MPNINKKEFSKRAIDLEQIGSQAIEETDLKKALLKFKKAKKYNFQAGNIKEAGWDEFIIANVLTMAGDELKHILNSYKRALKLFNLSSYKLGKLKCLNKITNILVNNQNFRDAEKYGNIFYKLAEKQDNKTFYIESLLMQWWIKKNLKKNNDEITDFIKSAIASDFLKNDNRAQQELQLLTGFDLPDLLNKF